MDELLPCPVCGEKHTMLKIGAVSGVQCLGCGCGFSRLGAMTREDLVEEWNSRFREEANDE